jgi:protease-4
MKQYIHLPKKYIWVVLFLIALIGLEYLISPTSTKKNQSELQSTSNNPAQTLGKNGNTPNDFQSIYDFRTQGLLPMILQGFSDTEKNITIDSNSILMLDFNHNITERSQDNPFDDLMDLPFLEQASNIGLLDIKEMLKEAATDRKIRAIVLDLSTVSAGFATLEEIRNALIEFKKSKKPVFAYSESLSEGAYYLASLADAIFLNPAGSLEFNGLVSEQIYFKGAMDKLGIKAEIFRVGTYKSAVEPFMREDMSEESREQITSFLNSIYNHYLAQVAKDRNLEIAELRKLSDEFLIQSPEDALKYNLITHIGYQDEFIAHIQKNLDLNNNKNPNLVTYRRYHKSLSKKEEEELDNRIAVIIASGEIMSGEGDIQNIIGSERLARTLREVREDTLYKAVVLRINSPGGSALASDVIWREIELTKKVKPVVASMSDLAASGGYYLAMACDEIVAQPNTITGSIGIFGMLLNTEGFLKDKIGITTDRVSTGQFSDIGNPNRPFKEAEREMIQNMVENGYRTFTRKAAEGRDMTIEDLKAVAEGRVWSGIEARSRNLVDTLGGFDLAIDRAAARAKIKNYQLVYLPKEENFLKKLLGVLNPQARTPLAQIWTDVPAFFTYEYWQYRLKHQDFLQMRLPYEISIK